MTGECEGVRGRAGDARVMRGGARLRALIAPQWVAVLCRHLGLEVLACHCVCGWVRTGMGTVWGILWGKCGKKPLTCCEHCKRAGPTTP